MKKKYTWQHVQLYLVFFYFTYTVIKFLSPLISNLIKVILSSVIVLDMRSNGNELMDAIGLLYHEIILLCYLIVIIVLEILISIERNYTSLYSMDESLTITRVNEYDEHETHDIRYSSYNLIPIRYSYRNEALLDFVFLVFPTIIIAYIIAPTLGFLYNKDINVDSSISSFTIDVIGHQWYWSYEYNIDLSGNPLLDINNIYSNNQIEKLKFDSILDLENKKNRLLAVDNSLIIPSHTNIRLYLTSEDVIHSWAVPQLGLKIDTIPGRITTCNLYTYVRSTFYGQCSELCGANHGFMPIVIESVTTDQFFDWYVEALGSDIS